MGPPLLNEPYLQQALEAMRIGVVAADPRGQVSFMNRVAERLTGWSRADALGRPLDRVLRLGSPMEGPQKVTSAVDIVPGPATEEAVLLTRQGECFSVEFAVTPLNDAGGRVVGLTVMMRDISEERLMALQLARMASHDLLTGLLNRHAFLDHLERALAAANQEGDRAVLLFLDIDQFKLINDTCDHAAGDELLCWVASLLRETVSEQDVVARLGGDEFALLVQRPTFDEGVRFAEQVKRRLQEYLFSWEDKSFSVSACFGVAPVTPTFASAAALLAAADHACYMAKERGRNALQVYEVDDADVARSRDEMDWMVRINHTLQSGQIRLYAQPIQPLAPLQPRGLQFEILLRILGEDGRVRTPGQMVLAAERYGIMPAIDRWVVSTALRALRHLDHHALQRIHLCSVNLSGLSLRDASVLDAIRDQLSETGIPPQKLCFEITETAAIQNLQQARWLIQELSSIGCNIALDDFGTGLASYGYLKELPVNYLKVAGNFIEGMASSPLDRAMVESINQISHLMGLETIAESVGTRELYDEVRAIGVDHAQGYWVGVPRPLEETCQAVA